jgi:hypothetical protein
LRDNISTLHSLTKDSRLPLNIQHLVIQNGKSTCHVVARSLCKSCSPEDVPFECSRIPVFSILEEPSASAQVAKKSRGRGGSSPHVVSSQGTEKIFDTMVSWYLIDHTMQTHHLHPRLPCPILVRRRRWCLCVVPFVCDIESLSCRVTSSPSSSPTSKFTRLFHPIPHSA